ncbi:MAG TPA: AzlD domain-containing protein [Candidatus Sulfotelmatobacter sp.]|nr:AzlD domain-containing protein [Candidatus Sulfotelmatobacter sp.]
MDLARVGVILVVGLACYLERALPQFLRAERLVRGRVATWLQYASVAAIAGLGSSLAFPVGNIPHPALGPRAAAILLAIAVGAASRHAAWATVAGVAAYLALGGLP